jgi:GTP-binding protein HflX
MQEVHGTLTGLKHAQVEGLKRLRRRRVQPQQVISPELATSLCELSDATRRQVGVLLNRKGQVESVMIGDAGQIELPDVGRQRAGRSRLRGLRLVHTHLRGEGLSRDDLTDLSLLRLDMIVAICLGDDARPAAVHAAHLLPINPEEELWDVWKATTVHELARTDFQETIRALEQELARGARAAREGPGERAVLIQVRSGPEDTADTSLEELRALCDTAGVQVADVITQRRPRLDPRFVIGKGKVQEIVLRSMQLEAEVLIFDHDLNPGQTRALGDLTEVKIVDRTQLILDIFAQHARTGEGKRQVELAQLKYLLPRLAGRHTELSRQGGGLGARGPGEKRLEMDRRRMRERIHRLQKEIDKAGRHRSQRRSLRRARQLPVVAIVGYTNAGKSTLLNTLTNSTVRAEDRLFATLDPTTRRLRFPRERELVLADTVGFIRDLPEDLLRAFRATFEEMADADLLLHVADASDPALPDHLAAVEGILDDLGLREVPRLLVLNKADLVDADEVAAEASTRGAIPISALDKDSTIPLLEEVEAMLWKEGIDVAPIH